MALPQLPKLVTRVRFPSLASFRVVFCAPRGRLLVVDQRRLGTRIAAILLVACTGMAVSAQTLSFAQGLVEAAGTDAEFRTLQIGDDLSGYTVLRLGTDAYAELRTNQGILRIGAPGEYSLTELRTTPPPQAPGSGTAGRLLGQVRGRPDPRTSTAAGARAVNPTAPPPVDWTGQEIIRAQLEEGLSFLVAGRPEQAIRPLRDVLDYAYLTPLEPYAASLLALAQHRAGLTPEALQTLGELQEFAEVNVREDAVYALAAAEIYLETNNPSAVVSETIILSMESGLAPADFAAIGIPRYLALQNLGRTQEATALRAELLSLPLPPDLAAAVAGLPVAE